MTIRHEAVYVRRRRVALGLLVGLALVCYLLVRLVVSASQADAKPNAAHSAATVRSSSGGSATGSAGSTGSATTPSAAPTSTSTGGPAASPSVTGKPGQSSTTVLARVKQLAGSTTPAAVVAAPNGGVFAPTMTDRHSVTAYLADGTLSGTISDTVNLGSFAVSGHPGLSLGAPDAVAFSPNGSRAYIANSAMTGSGFASTPTASCAKGTSGAVSYLYRVATNDLSIDKVIAVGSLPTGVAVTPDGKQVLATNRCSGDLSVISSASGKQVARIHVGGAPVGLAVSPDSRTAYVSLPGKDAVVRVDLRSHQVSPLADVSRPEDLVLSRTGSQLFAVDGGSANAGVTSIDTGSGKVVATVHVGKTLTALAISPDGTALYAAGAGPFALTKLSSADLSVLQRVRTGADAVGVTYEPTRKRVWVALAGGGISVFDDRRAAAPTAGSASSTTPTAGSASSTSPTASSSSSAP